MAVLVNISQHVLWRSTDTYAFMLIYYQMPSLSASLDQIHTIGKNDSILFIYLFSHLLKNSFLTYSKLSKNFLIYSIMCCFTELKIFKIFSFEAAME